MEKHYFIGEGPEAEKLIAATLARHGVGRHKAFGFGYLRLARQ